MKRNMIVYFMAFIFIIIFPSAFADARGSDNRSNNVIIMPFSLECVENQAFEDTAVKTVVFQDGLLSIGDLAFANSRYLTDVYIPANTKYIGENAFPSNERLTIHGIIGSLVEKWAKEHQVPFVPSNIWNVADEGVGADHSKSISVDRFFHVVYYERNNHLHGRTENEGKSMRPQDRPELNPIDYRFP